MEILNESDLATSAGITNTFPLLDIAEGNIRGHKNVNSRGVAPMLSDADFVDIGGANAVLILPTVAGVATIASTSATEDAAAGTHLQGLTVKGLDGNHDPLVEKNVPPGTDTTKLFFRIDEILGDTFGANKFNLGTITASIGGNVQSTMLPGRNQSRDIATTIPRGCVGYLGVTSVHPGTSKNVSIKFKHGRDGIFYEGGEIGIAAGSDFEIDHKFSSGFKEKNDVRLLGKTMDVGPDPLVFARFHLILVRYKA